MRATERAVSELVSAAVAPPGPRIALALAWKHWRLSRYASRGAVSRRYARRARGLRVVAFKAWRRATRGRPVAHEDSVVVCGKRGVSQPRRCDANDTPRRTLSRELRARRDAALRRRNDAHVRAVRRRTSRVSAAANATKTGGFDPVPSPRARYSDQAGDRHPALRRARRHLVRRTTRPRHEIRPGRRVRGPLGRVGRVRRRRGQLPRVLDFDAPFRTSSSRVATMATKRRAWRARDALDATRETKRHRETKRRRYPPPRPSPARRIDEHEGADDSDVDEVVGDERRVEEPRPALVGSSSRGAGERSAYTRDAPADAAGEPTATGDAARGDGTSSGCSHPDAGARFPRRPEGTPSAGENPSSGFGDSARSSRGPRGFREGRRTHRRGKTRMDRERASSGGDRFLLETRSNAFERASRSFEDSTIRPNGSAGTSPPPPNACGRPWQIVNGFGRPYAKRRRRIRTEEKTFHVVSVRGANLLKRREAIGARPRRCRRSIDSPTVPSTRSMRLSDFDHGR